MKFIFNCLLFIFLTVITQIGGFIYLLSIVISNKWKYQFRLKKLVLFISIYLITTFLIIPAIAPFFGREKIKNTKNIQPTSIVTVLLNRNYVRPKLNELLQQTALKLKNKKVNIHYLDANFPFINNFPLLPHLSHNDGRKLDLSLVYQTNKGIVSDKQKSNSGYGIFEEPLKNETNQSLLCKKNGYKQYDYPKYITFGSINQNLIFSEKGTKDLINSLLLNNNLEKLFIEPHLKQRLNLSDSRIRYHGCKAVRHDDHIHIQIKK